MCGGDSTALLLYAPIVFSFSLSHAHTHSLTHFDGKWLNYQTDLIQHFGLILLFIRCCGICTVCAHELRCIVSEPSKQRFVACQLYVQWWEYNIVNMRESERVVLFRFGEMQWSVLCRSSALVHSELYAFILMFQWKFIDSCRNWMRWHFLRFKNTKNIWIFTSSVKIRF